MSRIEQFRKGVAQASQRHARGEMTMSSVVDYQFELLKKAIRNLLVDNKNFRNGYYAGSTPTTSEFVYTVLPRWEDALQGKVDELQSLVGRQMREDEASLERGDSPQHTVLAQPDPRPLKPLDLTLPLYDEVGREYQVVNSSHGQVVTSSHGVFGVWDRQTGHCLNAGCEDVRLSNERPSDEWIAQKRDAAIHLLSSMHANAAIDRAREQPADDFDGADTEPPAPSQRM